MNDITVRDRSGDVRVIAFYLPQYHPIPENDAWWGAGFTEWNNVVRARPLFEGHYQPHQPADLGYYDLRLAEVRTQQAELARAHGIDGFCYYWYWFNGKRLLHQPLDEVLASRNPDFPFCICWANENWTRRWDGRNHEILMAQNYAPDDRARLIDDVIPLFRDARYIRVDERPLFLIYRPFAIPDIAVHLSVWRERCAGAGLPAPYIAGVKEHHAEDPTQLGLDAAVEFPPLGQRAKPITARLHDLVPGFDGGVFEYDEIAADFLTQPRRAYTQFPGVTPMWDNTARRLQRADIVLGSQPELFSQWLEYALQYARARCNAHEQLVFINAWNEWAEGNHLEPDLRYGSQYLEAVASARSATATGLPQRPTWAQMRGEAQHAWRDVQIHELRSAPRPPAVSVVMPVYNHQSFLPRTLASIAAQEEIALELIAIDDGSSDASAEVIASFAAEHGLPVTLVRQTNAGAHAAFNRGLTLARAPLIALANSDDVYGAKRLARLASALDEADADLAFSATEFIDDNDMPVAMHPYATTLRTHIARLASEDLLHVLIRGNVAVSTGNLVFRRSLVERIGGFAAFSICHDWDFVLAATYHTQVAHVPEPLYGYRLHAANTYSGGTLQGHFESDVLLGRFFEQISQHPALRDQHKLRAFLDHARAVGLGAYIPKPLRDLI